MSTDTALAPPPSPGRGRRIARVALATLGLEVTMVALAFGWVAVYSYLIAPGGTPEQYQAYAERASPVVSLVAGMPVFGAFAWLLARRSGAAGARLAMAATLTYGAIDVLVVALFAHDQAYNWAISAAAITTKLAGAHLGGRLGRAAADARR